MQLPKWIAPCRVQLRRCRFAMRKGVRQVHDSRVSQIGRMNLSERYYTFLLSLVELPSSLNLTNGFALPFVTIPDRTSPGECGRRAPLLFFATCAKSLQGKKSNNRVVPEATPDELNQYFVSVGPRVANEVRARGDPNSLPVRLPRVGTSAFELQPVSLSTLWSTLNSMKQSGACGTDGISIQVLKLCFDVIGPVFLHIINTCFSSGEYPAPWKHSIIHPIHKAGNQSAASNYRPISIVPAFPKLIERIVQRQLPGDRKWMLQK